MRRPIPLWKDFGVKYADYVRQEQDGNVILSVRLPYNMQFTPVISVTDISEGTLDINDVLEDYAARLYPAENKGQKSTAEQHVSAQDFVLSEPSHQEGAKTAEDVLIIDRSLKGIDFQMAKCCQPVYGDEVFGFVTSGGGIKIHRNDCPNAKQLRERFGYRIVRAEWAGKGGQQYPITLRVVGQDDIGIVNNITSIINKEERILLRSISIDSNDGLFFGSMTVMVDDTGRLQQLIKHLPFLI